MSIFLNKLLLENFTCHEDRELKFTKPVTLIMGPNASGKSSVKDAFEWLVTGATRSTDAGGRGFESLIRTGEKEMAVSAEIANGGSDIGLSRTANAKGTDLAVEGWQGTRKVLEATLYSKLGTNGSLTKGQIHALLNSTYFFQLSPADQRSMLFEALGLDFDKSDLLAEENLFPEDFLLRESAMHVLTDAAEALTDTARGARVIEQFDSVLREERRVAKKMLDTLSKQADDRAETEIPGGISTASREQAESLLVDLRNSRDILLNKKTRLEEAQARRKHLEEESKQLGCDYDVRVKEYKALGEPVKPPEVDEAKVKKLGEELAEVLEEVNTKETRLIEVKARCLKVAEALHAFEKNPGKCVILPTQDCHLSGENSGALTALEADLKRDKAEVTTLESSLGRLRTRSTDLTAKHAHAANPPRPDGPSQEQVASLEDTLERLGNSIEAKSKEIQKLLKVRTSVPASMEVELKELNERIAKGETIVEQIIRREEVEKHIEAKKERVEAAQEHVDVLEALVKMFGPDGIAKTMLAEKIEGFVPLVTEAVSVITGGKYGVTFAGEDLALQVTKGSSDIPLPIANLSDSELLRVGMGIQVGLAKILGVPLLMVDKVDTLYGENRAFFSDAAWAFAEDGLQVVALLSGEVPEDAEESEMVEYVQLRG